MALTKAQQQRIDTLIGQNKGSLDIVQDLVAVQGAGVRDVMGHLKENKTLQGTLKTITHRTKELETAGDTATRVRLAKEIETLAKKAIKIVQNKAKE